MTSSVNDLFRAADLVPRGVVRWGSVVSEDRPGVYVVATTDDPFDPVGLSGPPIDLNAVAELLEVCPGATVDGSAANVDSVVHRLEGIWVPGEPVLYVGKSDAKRGLRGRIRQYYTTKIGASGPHSGGWPIKMLANRTGLWVHYAPAASPKDAEQKMVDAFAGGVEPGAMAALVDPSLPIPFANLEFPGGGGRKAHGFTGVRSRSESAAGDKTRMQKLASATACPTCFISLPRTGICDTCG